MKIFLQPHPLPRKVFCQAVSTNKELLNRTSLNGLFKIPKFSYNFSSPKY